MRIPSVLVAPSLLWVAFAGCLANDDDASSQSARLAGRGQSANVQMPAIPTDWHERALVTDPGHKHNDPAQHENLTTPNFEILGYNPLITDYHGKSAAGYFCGSAQERGERRLAVVHSFVSDVVLIITDITDLRNPQKLGELVMANTQVYDTALSPNLKYALLATSPLDGGPDQIGDEDTPPRPYFRDACTGKIRPLMGPEAGLPYASGVVLVDITNPRNPQITDFRPLPAAGAHSVRAYEIDGRTIALTTALNIGAGYASLFEVADVAGGPRLMPLSTYQSYPDLIPRGINPQATYVHDAYIQKHPITNDLLLYLAHGTIGLVLVNINDLRQPRFVSHWADWSALKVNAGGHFIHEALPAPVAWDGGHYTFIGEECGGRPAEVPTCLITTLDTTDPRSPKFVGAWTLPADVAWSGQYQFSTHYIALANQTLFITTYHGGVWAVDVSSDAARTLMPSIGAFLPTMRSPKPWTGFTQGSRVIQVVFGNVQADSTPFILDLDALPDGTLVVWDGVSGLYTVRFDAVHPAPAPAPWPMGFNQKSG